MHAKLKVFKRNNLNIGVALKSSAGNIDLIQVGEQESSLRQVQLRQETLEALVKGEVKGNKKVQHIQNFSIKVSLRRIAGWSLFQSCLFSSLRLFSPPG